MMRRLIVALGMATLFIAASASTAAAQKPGADWVDGNVPECTLTVVPNGTGGTATVTCTEGKVGGLGNQPVFFVASFPGDCVTRGNESSPQGHVQTPQQLIQPRGGHINTPAVTLQVDCPPGLILRVGDAVTYTITNQAGELVFQDVIFVS